MATRVGTLLLYVHRRRRSQVVVVVARAFSLVVRMRILLLILLLLTRTLLIMLQLVVLVMISASCGGTTDGGGGGPSGIVVLFRLSIRAQCRLVEESCLSGIISTSPSWPLRGRRDSDVRVTFGEVKVYGVRLPPCTVGCATGWRCRFCPSRTGAQQTAGQFMVDGQDTSKIMYG
jgi:hypothetical protein